MSPHDKKDSAPSIRRGLKGKRSKLNISSAYRPVLLGGIILFGVTLGIPSAEAQSTSAGWFERAASNGHYLIYAGYATALAVLLLGTLFGWNCILKTRIADRTANLLESEEQFRQLAENIQEVFWLLDVGQQKILYVSPNYEEVWGRSCASLYASAEPWPDAVFPEDLIRVRQVITTSRTTGKYDEEFRIVRPDGSIRWIRERAFPVRNSSGAIYRMAGVAEDITARKSAETELKWKTAFLEAQVSSSIDGILVVDPQGRKTLQNPQLSLLLGIPQKIADVENDDEQRQWVTDMTVNPEQFAEKIAFLNAHPNEISRDEIELKNGTMLDRYSSPVIGKDGSYYGRIWTFRDITERKLTMEALRASEQRFKSLFDQAAVGVVQTDATTGRFVQVNQRFCAITGRSREELKQLTFADITHPLDIEQGLDVAAKIKQGPMREFAHEKRYLRKDGSMVWVNLTVSAMWNPGETPDYFIAVAQDVTDRKTLEEQFRQAQKMEAIGTLAGGIAHDFNNILAAITGYTELCRMKLTGNPELGEYLNAVLQASNRATDLVRQILAFSRQQLPARQSIQLGPVIEETLQLLRASIPSTIQFEISLGTDAPTVLADPTQVHQILMNLGTNAWHAMKDRPGRMNVKLERCVVDEMHAVTQTRLNPGVYARLSVSDTGTGMDSATQQRIFEPFFTTKSTGEGTGLGLAVVHGIMASHDGVVTVYSEPGFGTTVHLYFPEFCGDTTVSESPETAVPLGNGERILFIDDEEVLTRLGQTALTALGYKVETSTQPAAALAMVQADPTRFALIITDQTMPSMTGLILAGQVRQIQPRLPIILMTGYGLFLTEDRLKEAGIQQLLLKPTTLHSLGVAVHSAISAA